MSEQHAPPSRDPADDGTLLGMVRLVLDKFLQGVDDMLPARVISYDRESNRAQVQPLVRLLTTDNRQIGRAPVASVPVMQFGGGGVALSFNLRAGDLGWIKANDRDVSVFLRTYAEAAPNTLRKHSFQDAVFVPDVMHGMAINAEDESHAVLQTTDGSVRVAIWPDRVKITAGSVGLTVGPSASTFTGHVVMPDGASIGGIEFGSHRHTGVQSGSGTSGGPTS